MECVIIIMLHVRCKCLTIQSMITIQLFFAESEPVSMSIQLEYIDGLILDVTLGLGQPFTVRSYIVESIIR